MRSWFSFESIAEKLLAFALNFLQQHLLSGRQKLRLALVQLLENLCGSFGRSRINGLKFRRRFLHERLDLLHLFRGEIKF